MKIIIYQPRVSYYVGGGEVVPLEHARYLVRIGHDVTILTSRITTIPQSSYFKDFVKNNPAVHMVFIDVPSSLEWIYKESPGSNWKRWDLESINIARLAIVKINKMTSDLVITHNVIDCLAIPVDMKSVLHLHGYPEDLNYLYELILENKKNLVAVSNLIKDKWERLSSNKNITVSTNGVDSERFFPIQSVSKTYDFLYVGRLIEIKGIQYIIQSISELQAKHGISACLAIAGKGPYKVELENLVHAMDLDNRVKFLDYAPEDELPNLYNSSKIAVLPSFAREGILTTLLEAASSGLPIISTNSMSMSEFIENGENGLLVSPQDVGSLTIAMKNLLEDEKKQKYFGLNNRKKIEGSWKWIQKIKEIEKIYKNAI